MTPEQIAQLRDRLRLSRASLARFLGVAEMTVVRWENGSDSSPRGLQLVVLQALDAATGRHGADVVGRLVKDGAADLGEALRKLFELAHGVQENGRNSGNE
jgi:transcriptional regulator with XRE-family HTH domain